MRQGFAPWPVLALLFALSPIGPAALLSTSSLAQPDASAGEALAQRYCARCHAISATGDSPNEKAPPFRTLSERYPLDDLQEALAEGITVGHGGETMPEFTFAPNQITDLIAHMKRVSPRP